MNWKFSICIIFPYEVSMIKDVWNSIHHNSDGVPVEFLYSDNVVLNYSLHKHNTQAPQMLSFFNYWNESHMNRSIMICLEQTADDVS